ncbi:sterol desaturase family protein [Psychromonas sp. psych-6C06]|uniref:sterol desaturase family protein n=1 Tax=Psychromonas sp. psych-6C06 TaxID=2058089 RepID=UPI000C342627|nr:sterol desaturase family protein [Psychromonas sp. psych-6C06]PKF63864.1 sterol desaturase family protein [Psychromonas sp. psych-6C06]
MIFITINKIKSFNNYFTWTKIISLLVDSVFAPLLFLAEPQKRLFWLYLLSSVLLVLLFRRQAKTLKVAFTLSSSVVDLCWLVINQLLLKLWIAPFFALQITMALSINSIFIEVFGRGNFFKLEPFSVTLLFAFTLFIIGDFCKFLVHLSFHRISFLWRFHAVHHSANTLTPLTLYRIHPVEFIANSIRSFMVGAVVSGVFVYLFSNQLSVLQIMGVNLFVFVFNLFGSNLRHSPYYLGFGRLEKWFISPAQHQIHHSIESKHFNKNYGSALAIWDRLFKSLLLSKSESVIGFGLDSRDINRQTIKQQWWGVSNR